MPSHASHRLKQDRAIHALLEYPTIREAAAGAGIDEATMHRYLKMESFKKKYREARRQIMTAIIGQLQAAGQKAIRELVKILDNPKSKDYAKIQAAKVILEMAFKGRELEALEEIENRVAELEEKIS